ncbi:hypothetical protein KCA24_35205, partial [Escherichia coli]|nr:hypothetical protein [Escherichia coli]
TSFFFSFSTNPLKVPFALVPLRFRSHNLTKPIRRKSFKFRQEMIERRLFFKRKPALNSL